MTSRLQAMRMTFGPLLASPVLLGLVLFFVLPQEQKEGSPETIFLAIVVGVGMLNTATIQAIGYRSAAIDPATPRAEALERAVNAFRTGTVLRFALSEVPMLVGLVLAFVTESGGIVLFLLGGLLSLVLMGLHVWPGEYSIRNTTAALEADGAVVPLDRALQEPVGSAG